MKAKLLTRITVVGLMTMLLAIAPAQAQENDSKKSDKAERAPAANRALPFRGKIASVDKAAKTITLEGKESQRTFQINDSTKIMKGGKPATLDDAAAGEEVGGSYRKTDDGKMVAVSLRLGPKPEGDGEPKKKEN